MRAVQSVAPKSISAWLKSKTWRTGNNVRDSAHNCRAHGVRFGIAPADEDAEQDTRDVGVEDRRALTEGETEHRACRVRANPLERQQGFMVAGQLAAVLRHRFLGDGVQPARADVVAERPPGLRHIGFVGGRKGFEGRKFSQPLLVFRQDAVHLRLLQHDLGDEDVVRVAGVPPRQVPAVAAVPIEQAAPEQAACVAAAAAG